MNKKFQSIALYVIAVIVVSACIPAAPTEAAAIYSVENNDYSAIDSSSEDMDNLPITIGEGSFTIVDTGQTACFDDISAIPCPEASEIFFGQDAQYAGNQPAYQDNGDGTVTDLNTDLMWIQDPGDKVTYYDGIQYSENFEFSGYDDWRVPTIKELYSLMDFSGVDDADAGSDPFIDSSVFVFEYGDTSVGERAIDSQWITNTINVDTVMNNQECFFGVNFADGRIKCYPTGSSNHSKGYFMRLVRGDAYGENELVDNGDGTVLDMATGLMWQQNDSGEGMDWLDALNYCEYLTERGYDDWRLPNAKELQSIVDYSRSPGTSDSAAIDPIFSATSITNEAGEKDYSFYWTSTTHDSRIGGGNAVYIAFGRALGYFQDEWMDVHGAGAQRSDPKTGDTANFPSYFGPQGDVSRLLNYVRCVREGVEDEIITGGEVDESKTGAARPPSDGQGQNDQEAQGPPQNVDRPQIDLSSAAAQLGVTEETLRNALGDPSQGPPDLRAAGALLGVTHETLIAALGVPGGPPGN